MRKKIFLYPMISMMLILTACNTRSQIIKGKHLQSSCEEKLLLLYTNLEPYNGLLRVKTKNLKKDSSLQESIQQVYMSNMFDCWFESLTKDEVIKLYGSPNKITVGARGLTTFEYFVYSEKCPDTTYLKDYFHDCGVMRYEFNEAGKPSGGLLELKRIK